MRVMAIPAAGYSQHSERINTVNRSQSFGLTVRRNQMIVTPKEVDDVLTFLDTSMGKLELIKDAMLNPFIYRFQLQDLKDTKEVHLWPATKFDKGKINFLFNEKGVWEFNPYPSEIDNNPAVIEKFGKITAALDAKIKVAEN